MELRTKEQRENRAARRPALGSWHTITEEVTKCRSSYGVVRWTSFRRSPHQAMYIGWRTKFNGEVEFDGPYGEERYFIQKESVEVWLFIVNDRQNPISVLPFDYPEDEDID